MRLFVGVSLPGDVKDALAGLIDELRSAAPQAKWVPRDNLHLTLAFLGEVGEDRVEGIGNALRAASSSAPGPIPTALTHAGAFPSSRRARVLWVGLDDARGGLAGLAEDVGGCMELLGFPRERRAWTPHLTLARFRTPSDASSLTTAAVEGPPFDVEDVTLFRSRLARPAPSYEPLERFLLGRRSARSAGT